MGKIVGIGLGIILLLEYFDTSLSKPEEIEKLLAVPVLATVPIIYQPKDKLWRRIRLIFDSLAIIFSGALFASFSALVFENKKPRLN